MMMTSLPVVVRKPSIIHMFVTTTLCVAFFALVLNVGPGLLQTMGRDPTLTGRTEIWNEVLGLTGNPLLGTGFESFWMGERLQKMWSLHWWHPNEAHNGYLEIFLNLGWMGVILLLLLMITGYRNAINVLRWDVDGGKLRLAYILVAAVYSFTEAGFRMMNPVWIFFLLVTTKVPENRVHEETEFRTLSDTSDTEGYGDDQPTYTADVCEEVV